MRDSCAGGGRFAQKFRCSTERRCLASGLVASMATIAFVVCTLAA